MEEVQSEREKTQQQLHRQATKSASKSVQATARKLQGDLAKLSKAAAEVESEVESAELLLNAWDKLAATLPQEGEGEEGAVGEGGSPQSGAARAGPMGGFGGFDVDSLMAGMLAAAGVQPPPSQSAAAAAAAAAAGVPDGVWLGPDLDVLLMGGSDSDSEGDDADVLDAEFEQLDLPSSSSTK